MSATTQLTWDPNGSLPLLVVDNGTNIIYGPDDLPIEQIGSSGTPFYYHHDQLGSTRLLSDTSGSTVESIDYSPFGMPTITGSAATNLLYAGQYTDPTSGLIYMRARWYDADTASFMSRDPLESQTLQAYGYGEESPLSNTDPTGLEPHGIVSAVLDYSDPIYWYGREARAYENGCGYFASVHYGLVGAAVAAGEVGGGAVIGRIASTVRAAGDAGGIVASDGQRIVGFTRHGINRAIGDGAGRSGVSPSSILDTLRNPSSIREGVDSLGRPYKVYEGSTSRVVVNPQTGRVVSVNPISSR